MPLAAADSGTSDDRVVSSTHRGCRTRSARPPKRAARRRTIWCRAARGRICSTPWPRRRRSSARTRRRLGPRTTSPCGFRHLLVLHVARGRPGPGRRTRPGARRQPVRASTMSTSGAWTAQTASTRAPLRGARTYGSGATAAPRYVGLQSMVSMASSANILLDELDLGPGGESRTDALDRASRRQLAARSPTGATILVVRHFFYDWDAEVASSLSIERVGHSSSGGSAADRGLDGVRRWTEGSRGAPFHRHGRLRRRQPRVLSPVLPGPRRQTRSFRRSTARPWGRPPRGPPGHRFRPARAGRGVGGGGDAAVGTATGSYSLGNPWWETVDYARHQSSLNGHQAVVDDDGTLRVVIAHKDPGVANWLDTTAGLQRRAGDPALRPDWLGSGPDDARGPFRRFGGCNWPCRLRAESDPAGTTCSHRRPAARREQSSSR